MSRVCSIDNCGKRHMALGWCSMHYQRNRLGIDMAVPMLRRPRPDACIINGCGKRVIARGWCPMHYTRALNGLDMFAPPTYQRGVPIIERILGRIGISDTGCWIWQGAKTAQGYGALNIDGKIRLVHRLTSEHYNGPVPEGLQIDHLCMVRSCCNPDHLEAVTSAENNKRARLSR